MIIVLKKITMLVAVTTVIGHSILPHLHHDEELAENNHKHHHESSAGKHDHENQNDDSKHHEVFSFAQLDDIFIPAKNPTKSFSPPVELIADLYTIIFSDDLSLIIKTHYGSHKEYPPPDNPICALSFRGPPAA